MGSGGMELRSQAGLDFLKLALRLSVGRGLTSPVGRRRGCFADTSRSYLFWALRVWRGCALLGLMKGEWHSQVEALGASAGVTVPSPSFRHGNKQDFR